MGDIKKNVADINTTISAAAIKSGRVPGDIKLIGITKNIDVERIRELATAGISYLGENRVQEFLPKYETLQYPISAWHFVGHLQRNKVKYIIDKVTMIHSVDSLALAREIDSRAKKADIIMDILIEINIAGEDSKHGLSPDDALPFVGELKALKNICVKGLMCIAPFVDNPEDNRIYFKKMHDLLIDINTSHIHNYSLVELSMGMSGDYTVAIEEGATMVRIGTALVR